MPVAGFTVGAMPADDLAAILCNRHNIMVRSGVRLTVTGPRPFGDAVQSLPLPREMQDMAVYAVSGGAGFIGSNTVHRLVELGHEARVVDNLAPGRLENLDERFGDVGMYLGSVLDIERNSPVPRPLSAARAGRLRGRSAATSRP